MSQSSMFTELKRILAAQEIKHDMGIDMARIHSCDEQLIHQLLNMGFSIKKRGDLNGNYLYVAMDSADEFKIAPEYWFWNQDYRHYMREASLETRQKVYNAFMFEMLPLDGNTPRHAYIVVYICKPEQVKYFVSLGEGLIDYNQFTDEYIEIRDKQLEKFQKTII